jgi:hypothetical protein
MGERGGVSFADRSGTLLKARALCKGLPSVTSGNHCPLVGMMYVCMYGGYGQ